MQKKVTDCRIDAKERCRILSIDRPHQCTTRVKAFQSTHLAIQPNVLMFGIITIDMQIVVAPS
jgi:hypothetical protein